MVMRAFVPYNQVGEYLPKTQLQEINENQLILTYIFRRRWSSLGILWRTMDKDSNIWTERRYFRKNKTIFKFEIIKAKNTPPTGYSHSHYQSALTCFSVNIIKRHETQKLLNKLFETVLFSNKFELLMTQTQTQKKKKRKKLFIKEP